MSLGQHIVFFLLGFFIGNGIFQTIRMVGKPRTPITPEFAATVALLQLLFYAGIVYVAR